MLFGLDAWRLSTGSEEISVLGGIGKLKTDDEPDRELLKEALRSLAKTAD